jgi:hypothetical protein
MARHNIFSREEWLCASDAWPKENNLRTEGAN